MKDVYGFISFVAIVMGSFLLGLPDLTDLGITMVVVLYSTALFAIGYNFIWKDDNKKTVDRF